MFIPVLNMANTYRIYFPYEHNCDANADGYLSFRSDLGLEEWRACNQAQMWTLDFVPLTPTITQVFQELDPSYIKAADTSLHMPDLVEGGYFNTENNCSPQ